MEQRVNLRRSAEPSSEQDACAWRSFGSVALRLVAQAEANRDEARRGVGPAVEYLAWAAE